MAQAWQLYIFESEHVDVSETPVKSIRQLDFYGVPGMTYTDTSLKCIYVTLDGPLKHLSAWSVLCTRNLEVDRVVHPRDKAANATLREGKDVVVIP